MIATIIAKKKIKSAFKDLNKKDLNVFMKDWCENAIFHYPGKTPVSGTFSGKQVIQEWFETFFMTFNRINFTILSIKSEKIFDLFGTNTLSVEFEIKLKKENHEYTNRGITVIQIKSRKIISARDYIFDLESLNQAWI